MFRKFTVIGLILASAIIASGCATYGGYQPVVDPYNDPNIGRLEQDKAECGSLANQAGSVGTETMKGVGVGALIGAAGGAAMGAIYGNPATGAATGAAIGGIGGGANQGIDADNQYKRA
ncbi:MAG: glycine zipper family protein, partial [Candidatus Methylumidiphilus sp.]